MDGLEKTICVGISFLHRNAQLHTCLGYVSGRIEVFQQTVNSPISVSFVSDSLKCESGICSKNSSGDVALP